LLNKAIEYFEHTTNNPLEVETSHVKFGKVTLNHIMPFNKNAFAFFAGFCAWEKIVRGYEKKEGFGEIITYIENAISIQKLSGAAIGIFKENLIARELGLKEHQETTLVEEFIVLRTENNGETVTKTD
jgi:hypothetical protein